MRASAQATVLPVFESATSLRGTAAAAAAARRGRPPAATTTRQVEKKKNPLGLGFGLRVVEAARPPPPARWASLSGPV
jgi:hypothetical protein